MKLSIEDFRAQMQYLAIRFPQVSAELIDAYYEFLKNIPTERFVQVCKSIFCNWTEERFPAPIVFIEEARAIACREVLSQPPSPEVEIDITDPEWIAASDHFFAMLPETVEEPAKPRLQNNSNGVEKLIQWFHDPKLYQIAIKCAESRTDVELVRDENGNPIDLRPKKQFSNAA